MAKRAVLVVAATLGAALVCAPREAHALGPVDLEVGAKAGVGTNPFGTVNPLGFGVGARAGVNFMGLYGGLQFMYYVGSSGDVQPVGAGLITEHVSENAFMYGIEGGYGSGIGPLKLRAQVGVGNLQINVSGAQSSNAGKLYIEPGATALISLGLVYIGADANILVLPDAADPINGDSSWRFAFTLHGQVGVTF